MTNTQNQQLKDCLNYLYSYIGRYSKTEKGYIDKLFQKGYEAVIIYQAIDIAKQKRFIDDDNFAEFYVERYKNNKGALKIKNELLQKGIDSDIANKYLDYDQSPAALAVATKYMRGKDASYDNINRLYRHLATKGFDYSAIKNAIDTIKTDVDWG